MVLTKDELIAALQEEVKLLLHLASKASPENLDYRPTPGQRSTLELLQYLTMMGPIHLGAVRKPVLDMDAWQVAWNDQQATAAKLNLEETKEAIAKLSSILADLVNVYSDADFREELQLFGAKSSRGSWIVSLVLNHYAAYRMQLFLYLKASGRGELNTMNLWVGRDNF